MKNVMPRVSFVVIMLMLTAACRQSVEVVETAVSIPTRLPVTNTPIPNTPTPAPPIEQPITPIPLAQPANSRNAQFSGMAWYGDWLILLPQYPGFAASGQRDFLYALPKADILAFLDGELAGPLAPSPVPMETLDVKSGIAGYEGYEAIAFDGDQAYLTVEASPRGGMMGYLLAGRMQPDLSGFVVDTTIIAPIPPQATLSNMSDETLLVVEDAVVTIYEANGAAVNPSPQAHLYGRDLILQETIPFPVIEYRITDATALDGDGRFWAINYLYPGDKGKLRPGDDRLAAQFGQGKSHAQSDAVERLVEFQYSENSVTLTGAPPIQLELAPGDARNWEGIVRLDARGFLLVTDTFPQTILAFVPAP